MFNWFKTEKTPVKLAKYFSRAELACRCGCLKLPVTDYITMSIKALDKSREDFGKPIKLNCAYRDPIHNAKVGGAPRSQHKVNIAFDISIVGYTNKEKAELLAALKKNGFGAFGFYRTFLHVDMRQGAAWSTKGARKVWQNVVGVSSIIGKRKKFWKE